MKASFLYRQIKNALDFHVAYYLGNQIERNRDNEVAEGFGYSLGNGFYESF